MDYNILADDLDKLYNLVDMAGFNEMAESIEARPLDDIETWALEIIKSATKAIRDYSRSPVGIPVLPLMTSTGHSFTASTTPVWFNSKSYEEK